MVTIFRNLLIFSGNGAVKRVIDCNCGKIQFRINVDLVPINKIPSSESNLNGRWRARYDMSIRHDSSALFHSLPAISTDGRRIAANEARIWKDTILEAA